MAHFSPIIFSLLLPCYYPSQVSLSLRASRLWLTWVFRRSTCKYSHKFSRPVCVCVCVCVCPTYGPPRCVQVPRGTTQRSIMMHIIAKGVMQRVRFDLTKFRRKKWVHKSHYSRCVLFQTLSLLLAASWTQSSDESPFFIANRWCSSSISNTSLKE
jgi:hypothetical protein